MRTTWRTRRVHRERCWSPLSAGGYGGRAGSWRAGLILAVGMSASVSARAGEPYVWPLGDFDCITSSFCDYRPGHFHAGIDLSTGGTEGLAVFAADSGWVSRARASCGGYGKAVYVGLEDGRTAVYAHLSRFSPAVARVIRQEQRRRGSYEVDLSLDPGVIRVARGEIIGYTGQTGAGPPHLHFELRDPNQHPVNPLASGVLVEDGIAPVLTRLIFRPLDHASFVNGGRSELEVDLRWSPAEGCYVPSEKVICSGRVGLLLEGYDRVNACARNLSLNVITLGLDGETAFEIHLHEFGYDETGRIDTYYDRGRRRSRKEEFHRLFRAKGNRFSFCDPWREGDGVIRYGRDEGAGLKPGVHAVAVRARDAAGNASEARVDLVLNEAPMIREIDVRPTEGGVEVTTTVQDPEGDDVSVRVRAVRDRGKTWVERRAERLESGRFRAFLPGIEPDGAGVAVDAADRWGSPSNPQYRDLGPCTRPSKGTSLDVRADLGPTLDYLDIEIESSVSLTHPPTVWFPGLDTQASQGPIAQVGPSLYRAVVPLTREFNGRVPVRAAGRALDGGVLEGGCEICIWSVSPEAGGRLVYPADSGREVFSARIPPGKAYRDLWLIARPGEPWSGFGDVRPAGSTLEIHPPDAVFAGPVSIALSWEGPGPPAERMGICSVCEGSGWEWVGGRPDSAGGRFRSSVRYLSGFCLGVDSVSPRVRIVKPAEGTHRATVERIFRATASDGGSGLGCESVGMELDGDRLITEFDPELDLMVAEVDTPLSPGRHVLRVWAEDRAGNRSESRSAFWVDEPSSGP